MERLQGEDGQLFIKGLANFVRQHEKALANSLQLSVSSRAPSHSASTASLSSLASSTSLSAPATSSSSLAAAFSFAGLSFKSHSVKPAHLTLTPHHLFYVLSRIEELGISVGPMNVRLQSIHNDTSPANYVSFLQSPTSPAKGRSDGDSIHSVSSVRSVMSGMSVFWSSLGLGSSTSKNEKAKAAIEADLKYLYSAMTKLPSIRLAPDHRARLIRGYEEFPFDTAVPLFAFKNLQQLDIIDVDFRQFYGWDRLADQLCLLTVKRAKLEDPADLITNIVLDDMEKRRRRSNRNSHGSPPSSYAIPLTPKMDLSASSSNPSSPPNGSPGQSEDPEYIMPLEEGSRPSTGWSSPKRPAHTRPGSSYRHVRTYSSKVKRSGSGSSNSSEYLASPHRSESSPSLFNSGYLSLSKWQRLKYLSLADNSLTSISAKSIMPLASSLRSLNLSSNLFTEIPDSLASLTRLSSLDLSNCMIESLQSLARNPLPAISTIKLKSNRLRSLAGVERLLSLENLNIQDNQLSDPMEAARLTGIPNLRRIWVKHNPFTRRHPDYRVTIFNLFRKTPGYLEDLIIDDYLPGFTERKQLVDRVPELERPGISRQIQIIESPIIIQASQSARKSETTPEVPAVEQGVEVYIDTSHTSGRRKKGSRRRIVDLSKDDHIGRTQPQDPQAVQLVTPSVEYFTRKSHDEAPEVVEDKAMGSLQDISPATDGDNLVRPGDTETPVRDDDYRQKVEALRQEFGSNWLSVITDHGWDGSHSISPSSGADLNHPILHRANSHAITSGVRTLG